MLADVSAPFIKGHRLRKIILNYECEKAIKCIKKLSKQEKLAILEEGKRT